MFLSHNLRYDICAVLVLESPATVYFSPPLAIRDVASKTRPHRIAMLVIYLCYLAVRQTMPMLPAPGEPLLDVDRDVLCTGEVLAR